MLFFLTINTAGANNKPARRPPLTFGATHMRFNSQTLGLSPRAHAGGPFIRRARKFQYCFYSCEPPDGTKSPASDPVVWSTVLIDGLRQHRKPFRFSLLAETIPDQPFNEQLTPLLGYNKRVGNILHLRPVTLGDVKYRFMCWEHGVLLLLAHEVQI